MEQNETGCQAPPESPILCVNNCGFFGTAATMNMCSKCHKDIILQQEKAKLAASIGSIVNSISNPIGPEPNGSSGLQFGPTQESYSLVAHENSEGTNGTNRCSTCRKRVGLTAFSCRCGNLFCSVHRYSDKHECPFDYQTAARDAIASANPVVKAQKLDKI